MAEAQLGDNTVLTTLQGYLKDISLEPLDIDLWQAQRTSEDPHVANHARRALLKYWETLPKFDADKVPARDIMEQIKEYSSEELQEMIQNCPAIQLTYDCNGGCVWCLYGKKPGVSAKFSGESVETFLTTFQYELPKYLIFYNDSDVFDWKDNGKSFVDIYKLWHTLRPDAVTYVSTSIPRGGQENFIKFMQYAMKEFQQNPPPANNEPLIRISVSAHNVQRVEATMKKLIQQLTDDGYSENDINLFFNKTFSIKFREEGINIKTIGSFIKNHDDIKDTKTPACAEGLVISPNETAVHIVTTPTIKCETGVEILVCKPGEVLSKLPRVQHTGSYGVIRSGEEMQYRLQHNRIMLPEARNISQKLIRLDDEVGTFRLRAGRVVSGMSRLIQDISQTSFSNTHGSVKNEFMTRIFESYDSLQSSLMTIYSLGEKCQDQDPETCELYLTLLDVYTAKMDVLAEFYEMGTDMILLAHVASMLRLIGREQVPYLDTIIDGVNDIHHAIYDKNGHVDIKTNKEQLEKRFQHYFGKAFGFKDKPHTQWPVEIQNLWNEYEIEFDLEEERKIFEKSLLE